MSYALTIGNLHILPVSAQPTTPECTCEEAKRALMPAFVFSITSQIKFRIALHHIATCTAKACRALRRLTYEAAIPKLRWLFAEECLLGCVHAQSQLYGAKKVMLSRSDWPSMAMHLASCPKESCAQLRRSLLLTIRDKVRPTPVDAKRGVPLRVN
jgi:hypothetical protein